MIDFTWQDWAYLALFIFVAVVNFLRNGKSAKIIKEEFMKFRSSDYRSDMSLEQKNSSGQTFDPLITQYRLNERTNQLEELPDKLDIRELIKSELHTALEPTLARLLPEDDEDSKTVVVIDSVSDDLDVLSEAFDVVENYRGLLGLDPSVSPEDVFDIVSKYRDSLSDKLKASAIKKEFKEAVSDEAQKKVE